MAERPSPQERTEAPTPRRREDAHRRGQVARSRDLSAAAVLLAGIGALGLAGGQALGAAGRQLLVQSASWAAARPLTEQSAAELLRGVTAQTLAALSPFLTAMAAVVLVVNLVQARGVMSLDPIAVNWSRINPLAGLARLVSLESIFGLVKSVTKLAGLALVAYLAIASRWYRILPLGEAGPHEILVDLRSSAVALAVYTSLGLLAIAIADYLFQFYQHEQSLRMTRQELVRELRETEGDPLIKSRLRAVARALRRRQMLRRVPEADVVVTNPTHLAVALRYDPAEAAAPIVLAMGARKLAERIRALALAAGVPLVENPPLAQALYATAQVGSPVPPSLYLAVAEVLAFVYRRQRLLPNFARAALQGSRR
ncbi:MAG TPA: EscU/YscU/HrcU family type III secretion system export apparatus switch protein [Gemmatimonadales bacterium]|nr:EscU/YscU/HrcU family type III secretion system export apparatus switch protein [Gemmatimonadales bacterium]